MPGESRSLASLLDRAACGWGEAISSDRRGATTYPAHHKAAKAEGLTKVVDGRKRLTREAKIAMLGRGVGQRGRNPGFVLGRATRVLDRKENAGKSPS